MGAQVFFAIRSLRGSLNLTVWDMTGEGKVTARARIHPETYKKKILYSFYRPSRVYLGRIDLECSDNGKIADTVYDGLTRSVS